MDEGAWWATVCGVAKSHTTERLTHTCITSFPGGIVGKNPPASALGAGDVGLILGLGKSGEGNGNPLQYSCLENSMDRGAWWVTVHGVTKGQPGLSN